MKITDEIRRYRFKNVISFANQKTSREYYALAVLKYASPNKVDIAICAEHIKAGYF